MRRDQPYVVPMPTNSAHHGDGLREQEQRLADLITRFSGTMAFVGLHVLWFGGWVLFNLFMPHPFDRFPFGLLTMIVSLEAIFLSTFVLMSQNRTTERDSRRERADHATDLWSEVWSEVIGERLGIDPAEVKKRYDSRVAKENSSPDQT